MWLDELFVAENTLASVLPTDERGHGLRNAEVAHCRGQVWRVPTEVVVLDPALRRQADGAVDVELRSRAHGAVDETTGS